MNKTKSKLTESLTLTRKDSSKNQDNKNNCVFPKKQRPHYDFGDPIIYMDDYWGHFT